MAICLSCCRKGKTADCPTCASIEADTMHSRFARTIDSLRERKIPLPSPVRLSKESKAAQLRARRLKFKADLGC